MYPKVSRLSNIVTKDEIWIHEWAMYCPPSVSSLNWPKRRKRLEYNMRLWRNTLCGVFYGINEVSPAHLGPIINRDRQETLVVKYTTLQETMSYPSRYWALLCWHSMGTIQVHDILTLLEGGSLYAKSDGSVKDGVGSHAYGFTCGKWVGDV